MEPLADILALRHEKKPRTGSERSELIRYFHERARDKAGKPYRIGYLAMRLSHLSVSDLYYMKSVLEDGSRTRDGFNWGKTFFGMLKPKPEEAK